MFKSNQQAPRLQNFIAKTTTPKSQSFGGLELQSEAQLLSPSVSIQMSTSQAPKPLSESRLANIMADAMNASSSSQEREEADRAAANFKQPFDGKESPVELIKQEQKQHQHQPSQLSCLVADSDEQWICCHRPRLTASRTSTESMRACAMEATRHKWRTIGRELRQISEHYERYLMEAAQNGTSNTSTNRHHYNHRNTRHYCRLKNSNHSSDSNAALASTKITSQCQIGSKSYMSAEWSKLLLLICLTITIRSAREFG